MCGAPGLHSVPPSSHLFESTPQPYSNGSSRLPRYSSVPQRFPRCCAAGAMTTTWATVLLNPCCWPSTVSRKDLILFGPQQMIPGRQLCIIEGGNGVFFETPIMKNPPKTVKILCFGVSYYRHINEPKATSKKSKQKEMRGVGEGHTSRCHYEKRNTHLEMEIVLPLSPTDLTTTQRLPSYATTTWLPPDRRHWGISLCSRR